MVINKMYNKFFSSRTFYVLNKVISGFLMVLVLSLVICANGFVTGIDTEIVNTYALSLDNTSISFYSFLEQFNYLNYLVQRSLLFKLLLLILFLIILVFMLIMVIIIAMDNIYRPNIPQYPFNLWLDRIIPCLLLLLPSMGLLLLKPFAAWFNCLALLILIHIVILIPLFHYWAKLRRWNDIENTYYYTSWMHPRLYKHISIALIYPLLWGMYFSLSRFFRLGSTINITEKIVLIELDWIIITVFLLPHLIFWILIPLSYINKIRLYIWSELSVLLYSIHILLLRYYPYYRTMELLFKFHHIIFCLISRNGPVYYRKSNETFINSEAKWRYLSNHLYFHPIYFTLMFFATLLIEIFLTGKLYYGVYSLFLYPLIRGILYCFFTYGRTNFVFDCCFCDYSQGNWTSSRYPQQFWLYFADAEYYFGFEWEFTQEQVDLITKEMKKDKWLLRKKVSLNLHQSQLHSRINLKISSYSFKRRLAAGYVSSHHVRWTHTQAIIKYHSVTALFARSVWDRIVLANSSWKNVHNIQRTPVVDITPSNMYKSYGQTFSYQRKYFIGVHEENIPSNFVPLIKQDVIIEPYINTHTPVFMPQANPDITFVFKNSKFTDKRTHALDVKTNEAGLGKSKILSNITEHRFETTLERFQNDLLSLNYLTPNMEKALISLRETYLDIEKHQLVWAENLHLFPDKHIPPLKIPNNFSYNQFTSEALIEIKRSELRMKRVSDYLYFKKVPQTNHGVFPKEALDLMEDSEMQNILRGDYTDSSLIVD